MSDFFTDDDLTAILGAADDDELELELGRRGKRSASSMSRARSLRRNFFMQNPSLASAARRLTSDRGGRVERLAMGSDFVAMTGAADQVTLTINPTRKMRVERLVIVEQQDAAPAAGIAAVLNFNCGSDSNLASGGWVPIDAFAPDAVGTEFRGRIARPGTPVTIQIQRNNAPGGVVNLFYNAAIFGEALVD